MNQDLCGCSNCSSNCNNWRHSFGWTFNGSRITTTRSKLSNPNTQQMVPLEIELDDISVTKISERTATIELAF